MNSLMASGEESIAPVEVLGNRDAEDVIDLGGCEGEVTSESI